jgi:hypothetical protein
MVRILFCGSRHGAELMAALREASTRGLQVD